MRAIRLFAHREARQEFGDVPNEGMGPWIDSASSLSDSSDGLAVLAEWYAAAWQFEGADDALQNLERRFGSAHPSLLSGRLRLAYSYWSAQGSRVTWD